MKKITLMGCAFLTLFLMSSCKEMLKNEIINSLKVSETILPQMVNEVTLCNKMYYNEAANALTIEYITHDSATEFYETGNTNHNAYVEILNTPENKKLLKRCAKADINIRIINRTQSGIVLIDNTFFPKDYHPQK